MLKIENFRGKPLMPLCGIKEKGNKCISYFSLKKKIILMLKEEKVGRTTMT